MRTLHSLEKLIVRSWSAIVARGDIPTAEAISAMAGPDAGEVIDIALYLRQLEAIGALPSSKLGVAS